MSGGGTPLYIAGVQGTKNLYLYPTIPPQYYCFTCKEYITPGILVMRDGKEVHVCEECFLKETESLEWITSEEEEAPVTKTTYCQHSACLSEADVRCQFCDKEFCDDHIHMGKDREDQIIICMECEDQIGGSIQ